MKRTPLKPTRSATERAEAIERRRKATAAPVVARRETMTTAIHVPVEVFPLLRAVAFARAQRTGGRPSVSALLVELVENSRARLEAEATG